GGPISSDERVRLRLVSPFRSPKVLARLNPGTLTGHTAQSQPFPGSSKQAIRGSPARDAPELGRARARSVKRARAEEGAVARIADVRARSRAVVEPEQQRPPDSGEHGHHERA